MTSPTTMNYTAYTDFSAGIPQWWADKVLMDADTREFWSKFEGAENSDSVIIRRDGRLNKSGSRETFTTMSQLFGAGVTGETELRGAEEKYDVDDFYLSVEWLRQAISFTQKAQKRSLVDLAGMAQPMLSKWLARRKDSDLDYQLITTDSPTVIYAGDGTSDATIDSNCVCSYAYLERGYLELESMGAEPYETTMNNGEKFPVYGVCITEYDAYWLRQDPYWIKFQCEAAVREQKNAVFTNAIGMIGGMIVYVRRGIKGKPVSRLRPEAKVYSTFAIGGATLTVGANNRKDYTQMFPSSGTLSITGTTGTTEFVSYSGKTAYTFTGCGRGATVGTVASSAAEHAANELVTLGKHQASQIFFGKQIAYRCFATPFSPIKQDDDYGFIKGIGVAGEFGQKAVMNSDDANANYIVGMTNSLPPTATAY